MEDSILLIGGAVLLVGQVICFFAKKVWVRLLPLMVIGVLAAVCFILYAASGYTNWVYLILLFMLFAVAAVIGLMWLFYGFTCLIQKAEDYTGL